MDRGARTGLIQTLVGVNALWLGLSMLFDSLNTLLLPERLADLDPNGKATVLGLLTFAGIALGAVLQPIAGAWSDRLGTGRTRMRAIALGLLPTLAALWLLGAATAIPLVIVGYLLVQISGNWAQAAHQALLPDLVPPVRRGWGAGVLAWLLIRWRS